MSNKIIIIWCIIIVGLLTSLLLIGSNVKKERYLEKIETKAIKATKEYNKNKKEDNAQIDLEILKDNGYLKDLDNKCGGYVEIKNKTYTANIKCN